MILKGSQRGNGADLAIHLMNGFDNERIEIAEVYGAVAGDLYGAFAEFEAVAAGTKAKDYLYSLSINPSAALTREEYYEAIGTIEHRLGLGDQPRAVVFHVKDGREHCHVVWSRIDVDKMRAVHMAHDRRKLMDLACELARKYDLDLPPGLRAWEEKQKHEKDKLEPTLAENAQQQATGISPEQRRAEITAAYEHSDSAEAFRQALEDKGYILAKGDRRGMVVVDKFGNVHSLTRYIKGHTAKQVKGKLTPLTPEQLPSVDQAKEMMRQRAQAKQDVEQERQREQDLAEARKAKEAVLVAKQAARRLEVQHAEQKLVTRQQAERLALHAAQKAQSERFLFRVRSAIADLMQRTPGLRSVLSHIQQKTHLDPKERQRLENEALARRHEREKVDFERRKRVLARLETREKQSLERALRREQRMAAAARREFAEAARREEARTATKDEAERAAAQARAMDLSADESSGARRAKGEALAKLDNKAMQDFHDAARDQGLWRRREFKEGEMSETFNDEAGFVEGAQEAGDDDDDRTPGRKQRTEKRARGHRPRRGKGYGYRRDSK